MTGYKCPHCEKVFTRRSSLRNHTKIHERVEIDKILHEISVEEEEPIDTEHVELPETNDEILETSYNRLEIEEVNNEQEVLSDNRERLEVSDKEEREGEEDILSEGEKGMFEEEERDENHLQVS